MATIHRARLAITTATALLATALVSTLVGLTTTNPAAASSIGAVHRRMPVLPILRQSPPSIHKLPTLRRTPASPWNTSHRTAAVTVAPFLGTLVTHSATAATESRAGIKVAMLELSWRNFEPAQGVFDAGYATWLRTQLRSLRAAGMQVTLGLGLHYTPQWVLDLGGTAMVDQHGTTSAGADLVFNQTVRSLAAQYLRAVDDTVGLENFWAVRIQSGPTAELDYPSYAYWAYSAGAQNGPTRPATMAPNPMPGWRPGDPATPAQRQAWAAWYVAALDDVADWQMDTLAALGFTGYFQILTPGQGLRPAQYTALLSGNLPDVSLLGRGAVWDRVYAGLTRRSHVTAYVSSVADGSGGDDTCQVGDAATPIGSPAAQAWSGVRWVARLARENGFTVAGEIPGYPSSVAARLHYADVSAAGELARAEAQVRSCGLLGLYWAHDDQVANATMPLAQLARYSTPDALAPAAAG